MKTLNKMDQALKNLNDANKTKKPKLELPKPKPKPKNAPTFKVVDGLKPRLFIINGKTTIN